MMNDMNLQVKPYLTGTGRIEVRHAVTRLIVPQAARTQYADAQLDDRLVHPNRSLIHHPPLRLTLRARFSGQSLLGTAGFGFWNHPLLAPSNPVPLPRAIWFFYASPPSHMDLALDVPGCGWKAAMIDATTLGALALAPLALPVMLLNRSERWYRRVWPFVQKNLSIEERPLPLELLPEWHTYSIEWGSDHARFRVDDQIVLETDRAPRGPMCFVAWVDNRLAVVTPTGSIQFGLFDVNEPQWLELEDIKPLE
jgi:Glycosyl hydrolases family 16